jgi:8-oxo-dGTP pyrophosphatase MutT (NUDIX family)
MSRATVLAAGGVLWRGGPEKPEVALVHRPKYDDWSLPKGKAKPGEHLLATGLREVHEETGFRARLGPFLTTNRYPVTSDGSTFDKVVSYWAMKCCSGSFRASDEVDSMEWLPTDKALRRLDAARDRAVLDMFTDGFKDTKLLLLLRRGQKAAPSRRAKDAPQDLPLSRLGKSRAAALVPVLEALQLTDLLCADRRACRETLAPIAAATSLRVQVDAHLTRKGFVGNETAVADHVRGRATANDALVVCAGKRVVSGLVSVLGERADLTPSEAPRFKNGDFWLLHHHDGAICASERHEFSAGPLS